MGGIEEAPDILALYPEEDTLIVGECTVGVPNENKIMKLRDRAERLTSLDKKICAMIFSGAERQMIDKFAVPPEIIVVDRNKIKEIFDMVSRGVPKQQIFSYMMETPLRPL